MKHEKIVGLDLGTLLANPFKIDKEKHHGQLNSGTKRCSAH